MRTKRYVAVIGPGAAETTSELTALAEKVGASVVRELGAVVVCGGLGGVMVAAARGARKAGGQSIGILPGTDHAEANEHLTLTVPTGLGELRDGLVVRAGHAVIAVGGSWGTTAEIAFGSNSAGRWYAFVAGKFRTPRDGRRRASNMPTP